METKKKRSAKKTSPTKLAEEKKTAIVDIAKEVHAVCEKYGVVLVASTIIENDSVVARVIIKYKE